MSEGDKFVGKEVALTWDEKGKHAWWTWGTPEQLKEYFTCHDHLKQITPRSPLYSTVVMFAGLDEVVL